MIIILIGVDEEVSQPGRALLYPVYDSTSKSIIENVSLGGALIPRPLPYQGNAKQLPLTVDSNNEVEVTGSKPAQVSIG